ncbi:MAG: single-stranded DNA-binding protein [Patescibacteria group bacterium]
MNLNKVYLIGRLTQDPEVKSIPSGQNVASFSMATNRTWKDQNGQKQEQVEFHNIVVWRKLADIAGQYLKKGQLLMVEGRLQTRNWVGQDGVKRYRTEIVAENFQMGPKTSMNTMPQNNASFKNTAQNFSAPSATPSSREEIPIIQIDDEPSAQMDSMNDTDSEVVPF